MPSEVTAAAASVQAARFAAGARRFALRAGGLALLRTLNRDAVRIVAYHRFPESCLPNLHRQCRYLRDHHRVVSLDDIDRWLGEGIPLPANAVAVTVDDGYRDFYRVAYPVFQQYRIPVTVFLTTGFLDRTCWLWCDLVACLCRATAVTETVVPLGARLERLRLGTPAERDAATSLVKEAAKRMPDEARVKLVYEQLPLWLKTPLPETPPPEYEPLHWDEVREMHRHGMRFGAHTHTHPILSTLRSPARLAAEISGSKRRIESELQHAVPHFAYPNGTAADVTPDVVREVRKAGFRSAFMAEFGCNRKSADPYALRRNVTEPTTPLPHFGRCVVRSR